MSLNRNAKKRDANEPSITDEWTAMGAYYESVSGPGLMDNLVHFRGMVYRAETKGAKKGLTPKQVECFTKAHAAGVSTFIVRTPADARAMLKGTLRPWHPDDGALAGAARKERGFRPGTDKARTVAELCDREGCATSRVAGMRKCAPHLAETFAPPPWTGLICERFGCRHPYEEHEHAPGPVAQPGMEGCRTCDCTAYVGRGPGSLKPRRATRPRRSAA